MKVIALQEYTDKYISIYEGEIRNLTDQILAEELIDKEILAEKTDEEEDSTEYIPKHVLIYDNGEINYTYDELMNIDITHIEDHSLLNTSQRPVFMTSIGANGEKIYLYKIEYNGESIVFGSITVYEDDTVEYGEPLNFVYSDK